MMYRTFDPDAWSVDTWFRRLKPGPKLLFIYLVTSPNAKASGAYEIDLDTITFQTGLTEDHVRAGFAALEQRITWFEQADHVFIHNFYKRQRLNASDTFRVAAARQAQTLPDDVRAVVFERYPELSAPPPAPPPKYKRRGGETDTVSEGEKRVSERTDRVIEAEHTLSPTLSENTDTLPPTLSTSNRSSNRSSNSNRSRAETHDASASSAAIATRPSADYTDAFERFWEAYGRKGSKHHSYQQWKRQTKGVDADTIMAAIPVYLQSRRVLAGYKRDAEGWLADRMWENPTLGEENDPSPSNVVPIGRGATERAANLSPVIVPDDELTPVERAWRDASDEERSVGLRTFTAAFNERRQEIQA